MNDITVPQMEYVAENLGFIMAHHDISKHHIARISGVPRRTILGWLTGESTPEVTRLCAVIKALRENGIKIPELPGLTVQHVLDVIHNLPSIAESSRILGEPAAAIKMWRYTRNVPRLETMIRLEKTIKKSVPA